MKWATWWWSFGALAQITRILKLGLDVVPSEQIVGGLRDLGLTDSWFMRNGIFKLVLMGGMQSKS